MSFPKNYTYFKDREGRAAFITETFKKKLSESKNVLDVGCDVNSLKKILGEKVTGVDLYGAPDIKIDFEKEKLARFGARQFDFVVCTEVLEHLDNFHEMVDELFRVARRYVLVSLPNSLSIFTKWNIVFHDRAGKFYGLPFKKPGDRHRWFFGYKDVDRFFEHYTRRTDWTIRKKFLVMNFSNSWKGKLVRSLVKLLGLNSASQSYWILLEKRR
jgi:2-polyprenyl-3-methyl-5-hydroxy-6-metoxy-1,4-benzoquinol methylase